MDSISRYLFWRASWRAGLALLLAISVAACVSAPMPAPEASAAGAPSTVQEPEPADETEHIPNTLRWTTASEVDNFGFDVYRGDLEEGPFARMTESPIPGAGTTDLTSHYVWEDETNDPYATYYYFVESISLQGIREQFTPIIKAKPKLPAAEEGEGEQMGGS